MSEVVHGETSQIVQAILLTGQFLFFWESKAAVPTRLNPLKNGDGKLRVSSDFVCPLLQGFCSVSHRFSLPRDSRAAECGIVKDA